MAVLGQVQDGLHVHCVAQRLTNLFIVKGLDFIVQIQCLNQVHGAFQHVVLIAQILDVVHGHMGTNVNGACVQSCDTGSLVLIDLIGHLVHLSGGAIVICVLLQNHVLLNGAGDELEGAGADGLSLAVLVVLGGDIHVGQVAQKFRRMTRLVLSSEALMLSILESASTREVSTAVAAQVLKE